MRYAFFFALALTFHISEAREFPYTIRESALNSAVSGNHPGGAKLITSPFATDIFLGAIDHSVLSRGIRMSSEKPSSARRPLHFAPAFRPLFFHLWRNDIQRTRSYFQMAQGNGLTRLYELGDENLKLGISVKADEILDVELPVTSTIRIQLDDLESEPEFLLNHHTISTKANLAQLDFFIPAEPAPPHDQRFLLLGARPVVTFGYHTLSGVAYVAPIRGYEGDEIVLEDHHLVRAVPIHALQIAHDEARYREALSLGQNARRYQETETYLEKARFVQPRDKILPLNHIDFASAMLRTDLKERGLIYEPEPVPCSILVAGQGQ